MDLNDVWQGNKRFILGILGGLVIFLIAEGVIGMTWDRDAVSRGVASAASSLRRLEYPRSEDLRALEQASEEMEARLQELYSRMSFRTDEALLLPASGSPELFYDEKRERAAEELVNVARRQNVEVDTSLGLPPFTPSGRESIQRHLRALNVVYQVVAECIVADVRSVDEIEVVDVLRGRRGKDAGFIDALEVRFRVSGSTASIAAVLDALAREGDAFLSLEDAKIEIDSRSNLGYTTARFKVAALEIDPEAKVTESRR